MRLSCEGFTVYQEIKSRRDHVLEGGEGRVEREGRKGVGVASYGVNVGG